MGPVGFYTFGIAFVMPAMTTAALAPFPQIAGAASSMSGLHADGRRACSAASIAALFGDPVEALATIIPAMGLIAILCWIVWRRCRSASRRCRPRCRQASRKKPRIEALRLDRSQ